MSGHEPCRLVLSLPIKTLRRLQSLSIVPRTRVRAIPWPENWPEDVIAMTRPSRCASDQLSIQETLRTMGLIKPTAARRCAVWGRDSARGIANPTDERFVQEFARLVRKYEKRHPTAEKPVRVLDRALDDRLRDVVDGFEDIVRRRNRVFGRVLPNNGLVGSWRGALNEMALMGTRCGCELLSEP
jgi:hypothetical protein